ncbi:MAG: exosortase A [Deltaproteobacteria bacterium]|nr:MAG: exosortase A [Deltaproteobacteria bacterium]
MVKKQGDAVHLFLLLMALTAFLVAYQPVLKDLVSVWIRSDDYSHGFFVAPLSLYLLWSKRKAFQQLRTHWSPPGGICFVIFLTLYVLAMYAGIKTVASLSLVGSVAGAVWFLFGWSVFKEASFPITFLLFMIPIPEQVYTSLTIPLQLLVSKVSVSITALLGIPVFREGNVLYLPEKTFEVVKACSGIRSLMTLLCLCAIMAYFFLRKNHLRFILFISGIPAAITVNIFRVLLMIMGYHYLSVDLTTGALHTFFGTVIFIFSVFIVYLLKGVLVRWDPQER